jgi:predicted glycosyltransferase
MSKKILFICGSIGLGHVGRDLEIANQLRKTNSDLQILWVAGNPARDTLKNLGESVLPEADIMDQGASIIDEASTTYKANLINYALRVRNEWSANGKELLKAIDREKIDVVIGDEAGDLYVELIQNPSGKKFPFIEMTDYFLLDATTRSPIEKIMCNYLNRLLVKGLKNDPPIADRNIFIGEVEDVADKGGFLIPNRRKLAQQYFDFVGYILPFNPKDYANKTLLRQKLGYSEDPLIICSVGGTQAGTLLLSLCQKAYAIAKKEIANLKMILVCGPSIPLESIQPVDGVQVKGYVPKLYEHFAAADLCIVSGGGTVTLELTALQEPFLYFPIEGHFEQQLTVAPRVERHHAGVRMQYSKTTPESLAAAILSNIHKQTNYAEVRINGAEKVTQIVNEFL